MATYKIQKNDTLGALAKKYGTTVDALASLNKIKDPNKIYAGATLNLPDAPKLSTAPATGTLPLGASKTLAGTQSVPLGPLSTASSATQTGSIVDFLKAQKLPTDKSYRAQLYEKLGLGSQQDFLAGTGTGATNISLLQKLQQPDVLSGITSQSQTGDQSQIIQPLKENQQVPQVKVPKTIDEINNFQDYTSYISGLQGGQQKGIDDILNDYGAIQTKLGISDLNKQVSDLGQNIKNIEQEVRDEVARVGGVASESQIKQIVSDRTRALQPRYETLVNQLASQNAIAKVIQDQLGLEDKQAFEASQKLLSLYGDGAKEALQQKFNIQSKLIDDERQRQRDLLKYVTDYPDAGITNKDDLKTIGEKIQGSSRYILDLQKTESDISRIRSELGAGVSSSGLEDPLFAYYSNYLRQYGELAPGTPKSLIGALYSSASIQPPRTGEIVSLYSNLPPKAGTLSESEKTAIGSGVQLVSKILPQLRKDFENVLKEGQSTLAIKNKILPRQISKDYMNQATIAISAFNKMVSGLAVTESEFLRNRDLIPDIQKFLSIRKPTRADIDRFERNVTEKLRSELNSRGVRVEGFDSYDPQNYDGI